MVPEDRAGVAAIKVGVSEFGTFRHFLVIQGTVMVFSGCERFLRSPKHWPQKRASIQFLVILGTFRVIQGRLPFLPWCDGFSRIREEWASKTSVWVIVGHLRHFLGRSGLNHGF